MYKEYLKDMRIKIIRIAILFFIFSIFGWYSSDFLIKYFIALSNYKLITIEPFEMLNVRFTISVLVGLLMSAPVIYLETYRFVSPALYGKERKVILLSTLPLFVMTLLGLFFASKIFIPSVLKYLDIFYIDGISNTVTMNNYFSFIFSSLLVFGLVFCTPVFLGILSYTRLIDYKLLQKYQKHAIVGVLIFSSIITPDPFIFTMLIVSIPLILLYEVSIIISYLVNRRTNYEISTEQRTRT